MQKKVIWVFGESATGKGTIIEKILNDENNIRKFFNLGEQRIDVIDKTIQTNLSAFDDGDNEVKRRQTILNSISSFLTNEDNILLIKGQSNDMDERYGNTLHTSTELFPNLQREIWLLEVSNIDMHYKRLTNKEWYLTNKEKYEQMGWDKKWLARKVLEHRQKVLNYASDGFQIQIIDSTNEYKIMKGNDLSGEGSYIRRKC